MRKKELEANLIIEEFKDRKENYRFYDQQRNNFIYFYILFFSGFLYIINAISTNEDFLNLIPPMSLCDKQKIGVLFIFFSIIGFLWHLIIQHLRRTQIANAFVAAEIAYDCSGYLGKFLNYPFDTEIPKMKNVGYPVVIDILILLLNFILLYLGLFQFFNTAIDRICLLLIILFCYIFYKLYQKKGFEYELVHLYESINKYLDFFQLKKEKYEEIKLKYDPYNKFDPFKKKRSDNFIVLTLTGITIGILAIIIILVNN